MPRWSHTGEEQKKKKKRAKAQSMVLGGELGTHEKIGDKIKRERGHIKSQQKGRRDNTSSFCSKCSKTIQIKKLKERKTHCRQN